MKSPDAVRVSDRSGFFRGLRESGAIGLTAWRVLAWTLAGALLLPMAFVLWGVLSGGDGGSWDHVRSYLLWPAVRDSAILVVGVCFVAVLLGLPAAWCVSVFEFPGRAIFAVLLVLPLAVPPYVAAYASTEAREAFAPVLIWVRQNWGIDAYLRLEIVHRFAWLILLFAAVLFPYVYLAARAVFSGAGRRLSEAGHVLGAGPIKAFWSISLPLARPAIIAGLFLVAMEVLNDYGAVKHLGVNTMTVAIFRTWFGLDEVETARRLAGWVLLGVFAVLVVERWQRGRARYASDRSVRPSRQRCRWRGTFVCWLVCALPIGLGFFFPAITLARWFAKVPVDERFEGLMSAAGHSLTLGAVVTVACLAVALIIVGAARFTRHKSDRLLARTSGIAGYASPGAVMAVGVLGVAAGLRAIFPADTWVGSLLISDTLLWLGFALTARYMAVAGQMVHQGMGAIPRNYDSAASTLGTGPVASFFAVHLPLLRPALAGAAVLVFVDVAKELPLSLLLRPFEFETLGTWTYNLVDQGMIFACAAPSLVLIGLCAAGLVIVELFGWRRQ